MKRSSGGLGLLLVAVLGCGCGGDGAQQRTAQLEAASPQEGERGERTPTPRHAAEPRERAESDAPAPPWADRIALAAAIGGGHFTEALVAGEPYRVEDPAAGRTWTLGPPELLGAEDTPPEVYPTGPLRGHAIARAVAEPGGETVLLDYEVEWDPKTETLDGSPGRFRVVGVEVLGVGEERRYRYEKKGEVWVRASD